MIFPVDYRLKINAIKIISQQFEFSMKSIGIIAFVKENYYYKYNFFVELYNHDANRIQNKYMKNWIACFLQHFPAAVAILFGLYVLLLCCSVYNNKIYISNKWFYLLK